MRLSWFIAQKTAFSSSQTFSSLIVKIATGAVAISVAVMIITSALVNGFKNEISRKVFGFLGHIQITSYDNNRSYEDINPVSTDQLFYPHLDTIEGFRHIQVFAQKPGIIKTDEDIEGIVLKGLSTDFDWDYFNQYIVDGGALALNDTSSTNEILISQNTADRLKLSVDDKLTIFFIQKPTRARRPQIVGIYKTGLEEYDKVFALTDIKHIQKLNNWEDNQVGGFEIFLDDVNQLEKYSDQVYYEILDHDLLSQNLKEINPNIFEWLELQNMNERVIQILLLIVAVINMVTALLILILERTNMIGILKALGGDNWTIRKVFLYHAAIITSLGLIIGNLLGLGLCWAQKTFGIIKLSEESYYISVAPIEISWITVIGITIGTLIVCLLSLILPSLLVSRINPIKAIRFK